MARFVDDLAKDSYWKNRAGLGTSADRSRIVRFVPEFSSDYDLAELFAHDGLFAAATSLVIDDALRQGIKVSAKDAEAADGDEGSNAVQEQFDEWWTQDQIVELLTQYFTQRALFGGSILLQISNEDQEQERSETAGPDPDSRFMAFAPVEMTPKDMLIADPTDRHYGFPLRWSLLTKVFDLSWTRPIRTPRLFSTNTTQLGFRGTWVGPSEAYRFLSQIQYWGLATQAAVSAMQTLTQRILMTPRLRTAQIGSENAVASFVDQKLQDINDRASNQQAIAIDDTEKIEIAQSSISGMEDVLDRLMIAVSAATRIPIIRLFGVSPSGFGTGESELRSYYDRVRIFQIREIEPAVKWMLARKFPGAENWKLEFEALNAPTQAELIEMRLKQSQIDVAYIGKGVLIADEVAESRFGGATYSFETTLDMDLRADAQEAMDLEPNEDPQSNDNPPTDESQTDSATEPDVGD